MVNTEPDTKEPVTEAAPVEESSPEPEAASTEVVPEPEPEPEVQHIP